MRYLVSILFIVMLTCHVMPVKLLLAAKTEICITDTEDNIEESSKKEKSKDFFEDTSSVPLANTDNCFSVTRTHRIIPSPHGNIEIPPPDSV